MQAAEERERREAGVRDGGEGRGLRVAVVEGGVGLAAAVVFPLFPFLVPLPFPFTRWGED